MKRSDSIPWLCVFVLTGPFCCVAGAENDTDKTDAKAILQACDAGDYDKAVELAETLSVALPIPTNLEGVLLEAAGKTAQAIQYRPAARLYRLLVDTFPDSKHLETARTEMAACYYYTRQLEECFEQVKVNLKLHPESPWVEYWRFLVAQIHFRLWRYEEAKASLEEFLADYPDGQYSTHAKEYLGRIDPPLRIDENGIVAYSGKFARDIRLRAAIEALPGYIDEGFDMIERRLGVDLREDANVLYSFKDVGPRTSAGLRATTRIIGRNNKPTIIVFFYAEKVVTNPEAFRVTAIHELKHAAFLGAMGAPYHDLPKWVREGLALWGSDDIDQRVQLVLCNQIAGGKDPRNVLDGIDDPDHDTRDYLEDVLAFEWLASKDPGNIAKFCRRLIAGEPYREIWADLSGTGYDEAMEQANAHCRDRVEAALGEGYTTFAPLRSKSDAAMQLGADATRRWLDGKGKERFDQWLADNPGHAAEPMARLSLARSLVIAGRYDAGRKWLDKIIEEDARRSTLVDDARFWIGVSYNHQRDHANAAKAFGVFLRDHPNSQYAKQLRGKMPAAGPVLR